MYDAAEHFKATYDALTPEFRFHATTQEEFTQWQTAFRPRLRQILGLDNLQVDLGDHRPTAEHRHTEDKGDYTREEWHLWVEPTVPLPFYLLRSKSLSGNAPLVLIPHGHNHPHLYVGIANDDVEAAQIREGERDIAVQTAREGYIAIAPTTRAFGETRTPKAKEENKTSSCRDQLVHGLLAGRTPIGERVWDMGCLIDWALVHQNVDPNRIAITGNSGGGTISLFAAACDTRIAVAMPGSYFCTFEGSIGTISHCECNYVPGILRLGEMYDVAGLIAPRPFTAIAGRDDPIFPLEHVQHAYDRLKQIYSIAGAEDHCRLFIGDGGHRYYKDGAWPFLKRYFAMAESL